MNLIARMRKFWFGLAVAWPFLFVSYRFAMRSLEVGADLTAAGVVIGAIAAGVGSVAGLFVYGNIQEGRKERDSA